MGFFRRESNSERETTASALAEARELTAQGMHESAVSLLERMLIVDPSSAEGWYRLGNAQRSLGRYSDALRSYQRANSINHEYSPALCNQGVVLLSLNRPEEALKCFDSALRVDHSDAIAHYNRGLALLGLSRPGEAETEFNCAIQYDPLYAEAYIARGRLNEDAQKWQPAVADYERAIELRPNLPGSAGHLAMCYARLKRWDDALRLFDIAISHNPEDAASMLNRGNVLRAMGRFDDALASYDQGVMLAPDRPDAHFNRGLVLEQMSRVSEALLSFERAVSVDPEHAPAQHSRSLALLLLGRLQEGFAAYEWRWKNRPTVDPAHYRSPIRLWNGSQSLDDKVILVFAEQGLGDTLQFCRYVPLLARRGARVVLEVQPPLLALMQGISGATSVISSEQTAPSADFKVPLMSLPRLLGTNLSSIPVSAKYLTVDQRRLDRWRMNLGKSARPRIGLAWSGNPAQPEDHVRSIPLELLIEHLPREFDYFCLQRDVRETDKAALAACPFIVKPDADLVDTAALCECMDLVISVCTSIAHLAGALGRPLWVLLSSNADWRWLLGRRDSPWYPSAVLYRQSSLNDWHGVARALALDLRKSYASASNT